MQSIQALHVQINMGGSKQCKALCIPNFPTLFRKETLPALRVDALVFFFQGEFEFRVKTPAIYSLHVMTRHDTRVYGRVCIAAAKKMQAAASR